MRALTIQSNSPVLIEDHPEPTMGVGDAIVRPLCTLITQADIHRCRTAPDQTVPGHQFVGVVDAASDPALIGKRVVADINLPDPSSELARRGIGHHDPERAIFGLRDHHGCWADRFSIPQRNLIVVPDEIEDDRAVFALHLASALHVARIEPIESKTYVTVLGSGIRALLIAQVMSNLNASVRMLTSRQDRLELGAKWGIKHRSISDVGRRADQDIVIDTMEEPGTLDAALRMVRPRGAVILQNHPLHTQTELIADQPDCSLTSINEHLGLIIDRELRVFGSRCGQLSDGLDALRSGRVDLSGLITKRVRFDDIVSGLRASIDPSHIAVLVQMS